MHYTISFVVQNKGTVELMTPDTNAYAYILLLKNNLPDIHLLSP